MRDITIRERGEYKMRINNALLKSDNIRDLLLGDDQGSTKTETLLKFKEHVMSHLFIDETIKDTQTYIFFDVLIPQIEPRVKTVQVIMYAVCHRDILENYYKSGYYGNRTDILSEMIEECLTDESIVKEFGIGDIQLQQLDVYNSTTFYGCIMVFETKNFR